jgi:hypothetical protein
MKMRILKSFIITVIFMLLALVLTPIYASGDTANYNNSYSASYSAQPQTRVAVFTSGSLKENIERIASQYGWKTVVWNSPDDYQWTTYTRIEKNTFQDVLRLVLARYPLQAVFYAGNHVIEIKPRTLR